MRHPTSIRSAMALTVLLTAGGGGGGATFKYGVRPPSRYQSAIYASGAFAGTSHAILATLSLNGADISSATTTLGRLIAVRGLPRLAR